MGPFLATGDKISCDCNRVSQRGLAIVHGLIRNQKKKGPGEVAKQGGKKGKAILESAIGSLHLSLYFYISSRGSNGGRISGQDGERGLRQEWPTKTLRMPGARSSTRHHVLAMTMRLWNLCGAIGTFPGACRMHDLNAACMISETKHIPSRAKASL